MDAGFEARLHADGVTFETRDAALLRAVDSEQTQVFRTGRCAEPGINPFFQRSGTPQIRLIRGCLIHELSEFILPPGIPFQQIPGGFPQNLQALFPDSCPLPEFFHLCTKFLIIQTQDNPPRTYVSTILLVFIIICKHNRHAGGKDEE